MSELSVWQSTPRTHISAQIYLISKAAKARIETRIIQSRTILFQPKDTRIAILLVDALK